jgi:hypothetical protein
VVATVAVVCGVGLVVLPLALSLFPRRAAGERVLDRFRQTMSVQGLHSLATNFGTMNAALRQFSADLSPQLAHQLGMSRGQFRAYEHNSFPRVSAAVTGLPPLVAFVSPVNARLQMLHPQFAAVDSLPFLGLPLTTIPWILLAVGVALLGLAVWLRRAGDSRPLVAAAVLGVGMVAIPLALSYPAKASDAKRIVTVGHVALSPVAVSGATKATRLIDGLVTQVQATMIPAVANRLGISPAQLKSTIAHDYRAVAKGLSAWPSIKPGAIHLVALQRASVADAANMRLNFTALPWYILGPGIALLMAALPALATGRVDGRSSAPHTTDPS